MAGKLALVQHTQLSLTPTHEDTAPVESVAQFGKPAERELHPEDHHPEYKGGDKITVLVRGGCDTVTFERGTLDGTKWTKSARGSDVRRVHKFELGTPKLLSQREMLQVETALADLAAETDGHLALAERVRAFVRRTAPSVVAQLDLDDRLLLAGFLVPEVALAGPLSEADVAAAAAPGDDKTGVEEDPEDAAAPVAEIESVTLAENRPDTEAAAISEAMQVPDGVKLGKSGKVVLGDTSTYTEENLNTLTVAELKKVFETLDLQAPQQPKDVLVAMVLTVVGG